MTRSLHWAVGICLGIALGVVMLLAGGIAGTPAPPGCPHCTILGHPYGSCNESVQGGWVCP